MQINEKMNEKVEEKTAFEDPEKEEQIINIEKIQDILSFYKIPLVFALLGVFLSGGALIFWQSSKESAGIIFTQEATESAKIKADIEGSIVNPGVYELVSGSRIQDLLIRAGGLAVEADRDWLSKNLNLAAKLVDGAKVYIPRVNEVRSGRWEAGSGSGTVGGTSVAAMVNINTAGLGELDTLPGIGPVTAQKIIDNRPYQTLEELVSKKAVGQAVFEKIKDKISLY